MGYLASGYEMISIFNQRAPLFLQSKVAESTFERYVIPDVVDCDSSLYARTTLIMIENHVLHRSEEHTSELQSHSDLVCRLLLEKKKKKKKKKTRSNEHTTDRKFQMLHEALD